MQKLTKIVATIGPSCDSKESIEHLIMAGVNVFRFNTKHGTPEWHEERIQKVNKIAKDLKKNIGILLDLQGPEIRLETIDKLPVAVTKGEKIDIGVSFSKKNISICIPHPIVFKTLKKGNQILIDDGSIELKVSKISNDEIEAEVMDDGQIGHRKGVNFPGLSIDLPSLIKEDLRKLDMAATQKVDFVALSFSRTRKDIEILRKEMDKREIKADIVAKIESMEALNNIDDLIDSTDAVMVARGDLGVEVPIEQLAYWQKIIISKCRAANKPVITATQMLQSMTENPRPTRAEATDVANAVIDGTDAVMLSGETANGKYPVRAVQAMAKIAMFNETIERRINFAIDAKTDTDIVVNAVREILNQSKSKVKYILVFTRTGKTARSISRLRPQVPILAITSNQNTSEKLALSYGVDSILSKEIDKEFRLPNPVIEKLVKDKIIETGDEIIVVHGQNYYKEGSTNAVALFRV